MKYCRSWRYFLMYKHVICVSKLWTSFEIQIFLSKTKEMDQTKFDGKTVFLFWHYQSEVNLLPCQCTVIGRRRRALQRRWRWKNRSMRHLAQRMRILTPPLCLRMETAQVRFSGCLKNNYLISWYVHDEFSELRTVCDANSQTLYTSL